VAYSRIEGVGWRGGTPLPAFQTTTAKGVEPGFKEACAYCYAL